MLYHTHPDKARGFVGPRYIVINLNPPPKRHTQRQSSGWKRSTVSDLHSWENIGALWSLGQVASPLAAEGRALCNPPE